MRLFDQSAPYYDAIYDAVGKDYKTESKCLRQLILRHKRSKGNNLLDVACGTGRHISYLKSSFNVEGVDIDRNLLAVARKRNPGFRFHQGNMLTFNIPKKFDAVTCLFSAIGHMTTLPKLRRAIRNMSAHLEPGGVLIVEPWITPAKFRQPSLQGILVQQPKLKVARIGRSLRRGRVSILDFSYIIATPKSTKYFRESVKFGLFTHSEYLASFRSAGLKVLYYRRGLIGRGLYLGIKK
jgi:ubiquinone/menaquinone biosynthesis C-methylase UbiE